MKSFWQHENGMVYVVESDTFGQVTGATGPVARCDPRDPRDYKCGPGILAWVKRNIIERKLRRINPKAGAVAPAGEAAATAVAPRVIAPPKDEPASGPEPDPKAREKANRQKFAWSSSYHL